MPNVPGGRMSRLKELNVGVVCLSRGGALADVLAGGVVADAAGGWSGNEWPATRPRFTPVASTSDRRRLIVSRRPLEKGAVCR